MQHCSTARVAGVWFVLLILTHQSTGRSLRQPGDSGSSTRSLLSVSEGELLLGIRRISTNWDSVVGTLNNKFTGWEDTPSANPCDVVNKWSGVTCTDGKITKLELPSIGLAGPLPDTLLQLEHLQVLNLSGNAFDSALPEAWKSPSLQIMDLSNNKLNGQLPGSWGQPDAFPALKELVLLGNAFHGPAPSSWWSGGFTYGAVITMRPGNDALCGIIPPMDPGLIGGVASSSDAITGNQVSTVFVMQRGLMGPNNVAGVVNTLGSCAYACNQTDTIVTNLYDLATQHGALVTDLVALNPDLPFYGGDPGLVVQIPCYPVGFEPVVLTGEVADGKFAFGNQLGIGGSLGAAAAGATVSYSWSSLTVDFVKQTANDALYAEAAAANASSFKIPVSDWVYTGNYVSPPVNGQPSSDFVMPVFYVVDLGVPMALIGYGLQVVQPSSRLCVFVGNDTASIFNNTLVAGNVSFGAGEIRADPMDHPIGRYFILFNDGLPLSIAHTWIWAQVSNAAFSKPMTASSEISSTNETVVKQAGSRLETCSSFLKGNDGKVWLTVDMGYEAPVGQVFFRVEHMDFGSAAMLHVSNDSGIDGVNFDTRCVDGNPDGWLPLPQSGFQTGCCYLTGRYVTIEISGQDSATICDVEVSLFTAPTALQPAVGLSSGAIAGIVIGSVIGGLLVLALLVLAVMYLRWRHEFMRVQHGHPSDADPKGSLQPFKPGVFLTSGNPRTDSDASDSHPESARSEKFNSGGARSDQTNSGYSNSKSSKLSGSSSARLSGASSGKLINTELARIKTFLAQVVHSPSRHSMEHGHSDGSTLATDLSKFGPEWNMIDFKDMELLRPIGEGSYSVVYVARYLQTTVAVKTLTHDARHGRVSTMSNPLPPSDAVLAALQKEASIMATLRHPNCVQYIGACLDPPSLVMEHCPKKSVDCLLGAAAADLKGSAAKQMSWMRLLSMASDAAKGMLYLHTRSPPIAHRDLKSPNLLVDAMWHVKISDFNLSRAMEANAAVSSLQLTNPRWLAPEVLKGSAGSLPGDVFSFGVVMWELMTWELPWEHVDNNFQIIAAVTAGQTLPIPKADELPAGPLESYDEYVALVRDCWKTNPAERPTMAEVAQRLRTMLFKLVKTNSRHLTAPQPSGEMSIGGMSGALSGIPSSNIAPSSPTNDTSPGTPGLSSPGFASASTTAALS